MSTKCTFAFRPEFIISTFSNAVSLNKMCLKLSIFFLLELPVFAKKKSKSDLFQHGAEKKHEGLHVVYQ